MFTTYTVITLITLLIPLWYIYFKLKRKRLYELADKLNGPPSFPLVGDALKCFLPPEKAMKAIVENVQHYKSPAKIWLGSHLAVHVGDPRQIETVLNSSHSLEKEPYLYGFAKAVFGNGMLCLPVEQWKRHRRMIAPAFNQKNFEGFFDVFRKQSKRLVRELEDKEGKGVFDIEGYLNRSTLENVLETILDYGGAKNNPGSKHLLEWLEFLQKTIVKRYTNFLLYPDFIFNRTAIGKKFNETIAQYNTYIDNIMEEWKTEILEKQIHTDDVVDVADSEKPIKFVEHMMSSSDDDGQLTAEELRNEIKNIIVAGMETAASAIGNVLLALGMYPDVQEKLHNEVLQKVGRDKEIQYNDLKQLEYLEKVVKETLRIFPACPIIARSSDEEIQLDEYTIPADCTILISLVGLHRNPKIWPNPTTFDPDRFLPEHEAKRHPYSWIPFSAGPRNCIGLRFALIELKTFVIDLVRNYEIATNYKSIDNVDLAWMLVLKPTHGYQISLKRRV